MEKSLLPLIAELMPIKEGITLVKDRELQNCFILSDCSLAVYLLNRPPKDSGDLDLLVADIKTLASEAGIIKMDYNSVWRHI